MENAGYIFAAFGIVWAVVFGYVLLLVSREKNLRRNLEIAKEVSKPKEGER
ncbi:MAG: CcmD family protein [Chloroflexota bacterium]